VTTAIYVLDFDHITPYSVDSQGLVVPYKDPVQSNGAKRLVLNTGKTPRDAKLIAVGDATPAGRMHLYPISSDKILGSPTSDTADSHMPSRSMAATCCSNLPLLVYIAGPSREVEIFSYGLSTNAPQYAASTIPAELSNISSVHMSSTTSSNGNYLYVTSQSDTQSTITSFQLSAFGTFDSIDGKNMAARFFQSTITPGIAHVLGSGKPGDTSQTIYSYPINDGQFSDPIINDNIPGEQAQLPQITSTKNGKYLYASGKEIVMAFSTTASGHLNYIGTKKCNSQDFRLVVADDNYLIACARDTPRIFVYPIQSDGSLGSPVEYQTRHPNIDIAVFDSVG
jgi:hypothetical protein